MTYDEMRKHLKNVSDAERDILTAKCQENGWLKRNGYDFEDGYLTEWSEDYEYRFVRTESINALQVFFEHGNWSIRTGILYHDLAFINQVNGGDEYWTLRRFGDEWLDFESCTMQAIIKSGRFHDMIGRFEKSTRTQLKTLNY